eukprot:jgi/Psemu1/1564/gm1.1564_g
METAKVPTKTRHYSANASRFVDKLIARDTIALYMVTLFNKMFYTPFLIPYKHGEVDLIDEYTPEKHAMLAALSRTRICKYAVCVFLDWGHHKWETCQRNLQDNTTPTHGLKGKQPNNTQEFDGSEIVDDLVEFFDDLDKLGQPQPTRIM